MARKVINGSAAAPRQKKVTLELPVKLTPEEYERNAEKLAAKIAEKDSLVLKKKSAVKDFTDRIMILSREQETLRKAAETHAEERMVDCVEETDFGKNKIVIRRLDTQEIVSERAMDAAERDKLAQGELPVEGDGHHDGAVLD